MLSLKRLKLISLLLVMVQACGTSTVSTPEAASTFAAETTIANLTKNAPPTLTFTPVSTLTPTPSPTFTPNPTATTQVPNFYEYDSWLFDQVQLDPQICSDTLLWEYVKDFATILDGYTVSPWRVVKTYQMGLGPTLCKYFAVSPPTPGLGEVLYVRKNYSPVTKNPEFVVVEQVYFDQRYIDNMVYFGIDKQTPTPYGD